MNKVGLITSMVLFSVLSSLPTFAQAEKVERKRNLFGIYRYCQGDQKFSEKAFLQKMPVNSDAYMLMRNARKNNMAGMFFAGIGGALMSSQLELESNGKAFSREILFTGIGLFGIGVHFGIKYMGQSGLATDLFNESQAKSAFKNKPEFEIGFSGTGLGLKMKF